MEQIADTSTNNRLPEAEDNCAEILVSLTAPTTQVDEVKNEPSSPFSDCSTTNGSDMEIPDEFASSTDDINTTSNASTPSKIIDEPQETSNGAPRTPKGSSEKTSTPSKKAKKYSSTSVTPAITKPRHKRCSNACSMHKRKHQRCPPDCANRLKEQDSTPREKKEQTNEVQLHPQQQQYAPFSNYPTPYHPLMLSQMMYHHMHPMYMTPIPQHPNPSTPCILSNPIDISNCQSSTINGVDQLRSKFLNYPTTSSQIKSL